jgi:GABA(A) receptor-associated protein
MSSNLTKKYKYCVSSYKEKYSHGKRVEQSLSITSKFPDKLPIIVEKMKNVKSTVSDIPKNKFLIPNDLVVSQMMCIIRKYLELAPAESVYLFTNDVLLNSTDTLNDVYQKYKDADGFLYIFYTLENTFG